MSRNIGDWVVYNNPGHPWHGLQFSIKNIYQRYVSGYLKPKYVLEFGSRTVDAEEEELDEILEVQDFAYYDMTKKLYLSPEHKKESEECKHNVVENHALGKKFKVCTKCKQEIP
jgi:hypothetical protein